MNSMKHCSKSGYLRMNPNFPETSRDDDGGGGGQSGMFTMIDGAPSLLSKLSR